MDYLAKGKKVIGIEIEAMQRTQRLLDKSFSKAVECLQEAIQHHRKILITGIGKSGQIGQKIAATLASTGAPGVVLDCVNAMHGDLGVVSEGDVALILSYSGETEEIVRMLPALRRENVKIIAMTGNPKSTLAENATIHLNVHVEREACPLNLAPTSSTTVMLAVGDALAMVLLEARGFKKEDFARFHPGGTLGKHLLLRVKDVMRPVDQMPMLGEKATVSEALRLWNTKRAGAVAVVNRTGKLMGIFTHGDFVRGYQRNSKLGSKKLQEVMTPNPITVRVDNLAVEVLNVFQQHRIDDLIVVDEDQKPVGLVDAQDLAKQKLM